MADLMTEVHLVDGYLNMLMVDSSRKVIDGLYDGIFQKYGIDSAAFRKNINYYLGNPIVTKDLYAEVTKKLRDHERGYQVADSLRNAAVTDSIRTVQRFERLKHEARKLIMEVHLDTVPLSYRTAQRDFMAHAGLSVINLYQPTPTAPEQPKGEKEAGDTVEELIEESSATPARVKLQADSLTQRPTPRQPRLERNLKPIPHQLDEKPI